VDNDFAWFDDDAMVEDEKENAIVIVKQEVLDDVPNSLQKPQPDIPDLFDMFDDLDDSVVQSAQSPPLPQKPLVPQMSISAAIPVASTMPTRAPHVELSSPLGTLTPPPPPAKFSFRAPAKPAPHSQQPSQSQPAPATSKSSQPTSSGMPLPFQFKPIKPAAALNQFRPQEPRMAESRMEEPRMDVPPTADTFFPFTNPAPPAPLPAPVSVPAVPAAVGGNGRWIPGPAGNLPPISDQERETLLRSRTTIVKLPRTSTEKAREAQARSGEFAYFFDRDPWQSALADVVDLEVGLVGCHAAATQSKLANMLLHVRQWRIEDGFGYGAFHDPTGEVDGLVTKRVVDANPDMVEGSVVLLKDVSVLAKKHLVITPANVARVFGPTYTNPAAVERALQRQLASEQSIE